MRLKSWLARPLLFRLLQLAGSAGRLWNLQQTSAVAQASQPRQPGRSCRWGRAARDAYIATSHPHQMAVLLPGSICDACCHGRQVGLTAYLHLQVKVPKWCGQYVVGMDGYRGGVVGAKSKNLAGGTPSSQLSLSKPLPRPKTCWPGLQGCEGNYHQQ